MVHVFLSILPISTDSSVGIFLGTLFITAVTLGATFLTQEPIGKKVAIPIASLVIFLTGFVELGFIPQAFQFQPFATGAIMIANSFNLLVWFYGRKKNFSAEAKSGLVVHGHSAGSDEAPRGDTPMYVVRKAAS